MNAAVESPGFVLPSDPILIADVQASMQAQIERGLAQGYEQNLYGVTDESRRQALKIMNPIAREKYIPIFELLGIVVNYKSYNYGAFNSPRWMLVAKAGDSDPVIVDWTSFPGDPGCSLATWDAMVAALLDEVARHGGQGKLPDSASTEGAG